MSTYADDSGSPGLRIWNTADGLHLHMRYYDGTQFWLERKGREIWAVWPETSTIEDATSYLLGPVFGLLLRLRGVTCLHASAIELEGFSVIFVGSEGAGKSTMAAAFARRGYGVLSDDIVALTEGENGFLITPAYPHLCLWPESVAMLYGSPEAIPQFSSGWEKRRLVLGDHGTRFEEHALPLGAIYLLGERCADAAPHVEVVQAQEAFLSLVADAFANKILDRELRAREFEVLGRLISSIPIRRVRASKTPGRLDELCDVVRTDFASLRASSRARLCRSGGI